MLFKKPVNISTFAKYLLSYIAIFSVLIGGFFLILRSQLETQYYNQRTDQIQQQLDSLGTHIESQIAALAQTDSLIAANVDIVLSSYITDSKYYRSTYDELIQYARSSNLIDSIVYKSNRSSRIFSTSCYVTYDGTVFSLTNAAMHELVFDPTPYIDASTGQLVWLQNDSASALLYFPPIRSQSASIYYYILDTGFLQAQLKSLLSAEVVAVALTDRQGTPVCGINYDPEAYTLLQPPPESGIYPLEGSQALCVSNSLRSGFAVQAVISEDFLLDQVNTSFMTSYISLLLLSILGIILVYGAMCATYRPLQKLTQTLAPATNTKNHLEILSQNISQLHSQKQQLQESLQNYRTFFQKELLGSSLSSQHAIEPAVLDRIFSAASESDQLLVVKTACGQKSLPAARITELLGSAFRGTVACYCLNSTEACSFHLLVLKQAEDSIAPIREACHRLHRTDGFLFALSNLSGSILDIPLLCDSAEAASEAWPHTPIAEAASCDDDTDALSYPHDSLNRFALLLQESRFSPARNLVQALFDNMDLHSAQNDLPAYFPNCIVLDLLTILTNSMSKNRINFEDYNTILQDAIRLSRNYQPGENSGELLSLISELLYFYERETLNRLSHVAPLQTLMEAHFCQPDFSISVIAEIYHVSVSRMSVLFKKELGLGFADCLWQMRLKKAQELMQTTELSIDEISLAVGYVNTSSFRRKFKQETGQTPSQYRSGSDETQRETE